MNVYEPVKTGGGKWEPKGPGDNNAPLWPTISFDTKEDAAKVCVMLNVAYRAGIKAERGFKK